MCKWDTVERLGTYLGIDGTLIKKLRLSADSGRYLDIICRSARVFTEAYPPDNAGLIARSIFETDLSKLPRDDLEAALSRDVFDRLQGCLEPREGAGGDAFMGFDIVFRRFLRWFKAALGGAIYTQGLKKEDISLDSPGAKRYLAELKELPCRRLGGLSLSGNEQGKTAMSRSLGPLLKKYEGRIIPEENCRKIIEIMSKISGFPGYYKAMDSGHRLTEVRPILVAISELQLDPAGEPEKASLLSVLSVLLFNVFPSAKLLKLITRFKPDPASDGLSYEYYAILAMNHMLAGRLDEAASYNEKALGHAMGEEKRAYTHILDSCIRLNRKDPDAAVNALYRCSSLTRDKKMRAVAQFYLGIIYYEMGSVAAAWECFERSRAGLEDELDSMSACNNIGTCAMAQGDLTAAVKAFEHVRRVSRHMGSNTARQLKSAAHGNLGIIYLSTARYDEAMDNFKEALKLDRDAHNKKGVANQLGNIGVALKLKRDYGLALEYFKSSLNVSFIGDYAEGALFSFFQIEQLLALEGRYGEAERLKQDMIRQNPDIARRLPS